MNNMYTQYCKINSNGCILITEQEALTNKTDNIYFLDNVKDNIKTRAKDEDIEMKDFFVLDLDIYNNYKEAYGEESSSEDIKNIGNMFILYLEQEDEYFGEWSKIVFSGKGLHIYYKGKATIFEKEEYSLGVKRIYRQWDKFMGDKTYYTDFACSNLARILRLPGTINQKNGEIVEILAEREKESRLFNYIKQLAKKEKQEIEEEKKKRQKEIQEQIKNLSNDDSLFYQKINSIPAYQIAELLLPQFKYDSKKNFKNGKGGITGYWYNEENNTIINGGSRHFQFHGNSNSGWNVFSLIKHYKNYNNNEVFNFFTKLIGK